MSDEQLTVDSASTVTLCEITEETLRPILALNVAPNQERYVASNERSVAQAHFSDKAWFRGIYADDVPVGFIMLSDDANTPEYFLWRLMIDERFQGRGFGRKAVSELVNYVCTRPGATELLVSHVPGQGSPGPFYEKLGFTYTGAEEYGELIMRLALEPVDSGETGPTADLPLTHIVLFRLKDRSPAIITGVVERLRNMQGKIPSLKQIEVGSNVVPSDRAYDVALLTRFASLADMESYQVHPVHQEFVAYIRDLADSVVVVDYH
ncbi:MAG: GNAT family N-acetyltransferase [Chloroflexota bacterium]|nr:GNAT family N-acetyltransferase [Chloroflexota bacterium]